MSLFRFLKPLALAAALAATMAAPAVAEEFPESIRFGSFGTGFGQPFGTEILAIAQVKGFIADEFKDHPVKLEYSYLTGTGPAVNEGIANKQYDFGQYGSLPNIIGKANGLPTRILLAYGATRIYIAARADQPISSIRDLKGKKVTFQKGTILHWAFLKALQANGLSNRDVTVVDLKGPDQQAALAAGSVDASVGTSNLLALRDKGIVKVIYDSVSDPRATGFGGILVTEDFRTKYPDALRRVTRGLLTAARWLADEGNREEALQIWAKSGVPLEALREDFKGRPLKDSYNPVPDAFIVSQYKDAVAFSKDEKLIRNDIDVDAWFAPDVVQAALKDLKLEGFWKARNADGAAIN